MTFLRDTIRSAALGALVGLLIAAIGHALPSPDAPTSNCCAIVPYLSTGRIVVWYLHEWPRGQYYRAEDSYYAFQQTVEMCAGGEGHPIGYQIHVDDVLVATCGEIPENPDHFPIFSDGFESGTIGNWTN